MGLLGKFTKKHCPKSQLAKRLLAKCWINRTTRYLLPENVVAVAESDPARKLEAVEMCRRKWEKKYAVLKRKSDALLNRAPCYVGRTDRDALQTDIIFCFFAYGFQADEYLCYELEEKSEAERRAYISDVDRFAFVYRYNDVRDMQIFNNKIRTYECLHDFYGREAVGIENVEDFAAFEAFVTAHPVFVRKRAFESMGRSVEKMDYTASGLSMRAFFDKLLQDGPQILEELVVQSAATAALHPASVNTIRCITFRTAHGVQTPYCFMKVGQKGSFVDNGGSGGIFVGIDRETGRLNTDGYDELNRRYEKHPDTGIVFKGHQLSDWEALQPLCRRAAEVIPSVPYVGWDLAHTDKGWIIIEGNSMSQMIGPQIVWNRGYKAEVEALLKDMKPFI